MQHLPENIKMYSFFYKQFVGGWASSTVLRCALDSHTAVHNISLLRVHICSTLQHFSLLQAIPGKHYVILVKDAQW